MNSEKGDLGAEKTLHKKQLKELLQLRVQEQKLSKSISLFD